MPFELASSLAGHHLIPQPADAALNPPEVYFYVQDGLMIACGVLYALCYFFYATRTYKDKHLAGPVEYMSTTLSYELYYALATTSTNLELACFILWFLFDLAFVSVALLSAYPPGRRLGVIARTAVLTIAFYFALQTLDSWFPSDRSQQTAFFIGVALQLPISVGSVILLLRDKDVRGQSLEIWVTRCLGCWTAYGLFWWRWWNMSQNWGYVSDLWAESAIAVTLAAEAVWPGVYMWAWKKGQVEDRKMGKRE
ncbi:uncharacterized protein LTR77_009952 [Saxophila tyrrhenica]|uniref:Uncharacterized protein n=1 Tax=Saxophila tyrrhenica TaxID=1690608 RepID=A0AAV9P0B9_9PEZI|nr:hypothetical protein LTR77_009952 [Saxophila tyrrhenica]